MEIRLAKKTSSETGFVSLVWFFGMTSRHTFWFRCNVLIFAGILAIQAAWLLAAESIRPILPYFPQDKASAERATAARSAAVTAARIGWVRGDLWTDAAIALSSDLASKVADEGKPQVTPQRDQARAVARRAARLSPHDSRSWLLLAALDSRFDWPMEIVDRLRMSYFTGPNEAELTPLRIRIATRSTAITDPELQILVAQEIRSIVRRDEMASLLTAYRHSSNDGKKFIEETVGAIDENLLATFRDRGSRQ
jgi:hypothetical protein